jgi:DNA-binding transcriptional MerR regulator
MGLEASKKLGSKTVGIGVASSITGVEVHTLRYWEHEFPEQLRPLRTPGGQRRYRPQDIQTILLLRRLLRDELYSIAGARKHLRQLEEAA